jgi:hypothetical protein
MESFQRITPDVEKEQKPDCEDLCYPRCPKARHLGHPSSVVGLIASGTWATRRTESYEVKTSRVFVSDESARHRWKAYNEPVQMSRKSKTGLRRSVLSQVPKSEAPGAPIFSGWAHYARDLGHPPSPTKKTAAPAHSSRREHPWSILCKTACRELVIDCLHIGYYRASECR